MSESKKRKVHLPAFKAKVGLEALRGVKTINEIGQEYGVHRGCPVDPQPLPRHAGAFVQEHLGSASNEVAIKRLAF